MLFDQVIYRLHQTKTTLKVQMATKSTTSVALKKKSKGKTLQPKTTTYEFIPEIWALINAYRTDKLVELHRTDAELHWYVKEFDGNRIQIASSKRIDELRGQVKDGLITSQQFTGKAKYAQKKYAKEKCDLSTLYRDNCRLFDEEKTKSHLMVRMKTFSKDERTEFLKSYLSWKAKPEVSSPACSLKYYGGMFHFRG